MADGLERARENGKPGCIRCQGKGVFFYKKDCQTVCDLCCPHDQGSWLLKEHYGKDNGKYCCLGGCGRKSDTQF